MKTAIWWIRRDLRLTDNATLHAALAAADQIIPLFVVDPNLLASPYMADKRLAFLFHSLRAMSQALQSCGSNLIVRHGQPAAVLSQVMDSGQAEAIFAEEDFSPYARQRDQAIAQQLPLTLVSGLTVCHPEQVLKDDQTPYTVFTPYSRRWKSYPLPRARDILAAPRRIHTPSGLVSEAIPNHPVHADDSLFPASEREAQTRLQRFAQRSPIGQYADQRNQPAVQGTSQLSPYFRFGLLSARQAVVAALTAKGQATTEAEAKGSETWLTELIWREFYLAILYHFPHVRQGSFRPEYDRIVWANDPVQFDAWCAGQTGYPIVDAAMRQLSTIGWMHNRARMITASFLVKDLLIDWRWGEKWFMQTLIDGDPAANNGGWQWTAGTGTDAAPYFRIFNPVLQSEKFDPDGDYLRQWLPELRHLPKKSIHAPWKLKLADQKKFGCLLGQHYPHPIVDHAVARKRTLEAYKKAKSSPVP